MTIAVVEFAAEINCSELRRSHNNIHGPKWRRVLGRGARIMAAITAAR